MTSSTNKMFSALCSLIKKSRNKARSSTSSSVCNSVAAVVTRATSMEAAEERGGDDEGERLGERLGDTCSAWIGPPDCLRRMCLPAVVTDVKRSVMPAMPCIRHRFESELSLSRFDDEDEDEDEEEIGSKALECEVEAESRLWFTLRCPRREPDDDGGGDVLPTATSSCRRSGEGERAGEVEPSGGEFEPSPANVVPVALVTATEAAVVKGMAEAEEVGEVDEAEPTALESWRCCCCSCR